MPLPATPFRFILHFLRQQWVKSVLLIVIFMIWAINDSFFPYFLKRIINVLQHTSGNVTHLYSALAAPLLMLVALWVITEFLMRLQGILQIYFFPRLRAQMRDAVFNYVKGHSHEYFANHFSGNLAKKLGDLPTSCQALIEIIFFQFVTAFTGAIVVFIMMWFTQPLFAGILFVWLFIHLTVTFAFLRSGNILWEQHSDAVSTLSGKIVDVFSNMLNVRLFARGDYETQYLQKFQGEEIRRAQKAMWRTELMHMALGLNGLFLILGMTFLLIHEWIHQRVTIGDFTQVEMQSFWLLGWIWYVSFQFKVYARENGTITDALNLIHQTHDIIDKPHAKPLNILRGEIRFENVEFSYHPQRKVFEHFNVTIPAGQRVGLVGFSGSGKSTFVNLILRFYDIQSGRILIDQQNIAQVTQASLRSQIAMIPQDPSLFHRSLMENIRYGRLEATDEEVYEASRLAHCDEFIQHLEQKYDALVGERGVKLSGGQRQRIAIARAILKNAPILMLDEATSSLDSVTEKLIQDSLHRLMQQRTTIVVAHRLSTLANMDRILVFHQGRIVEDGTRDELLHQNGHFAQLWRMQSDGFLPEQAAAEGK